MDFLLQDAVVTTIAGAAFVMLVRRTVSLVRPSRADSACKTCPSCGTAPKTGESAETVVPLSAIRRGR